MNNYFISYEWDIVLISVLATLLVITILMQLSMLLSEWWFVSGKNKKYQLINSIKFNIYIFFEWINVKFNLNLFIRENDFIDISSNYIHRIDFHLPDNPRIDRMKMNLVTSRTMNGINPTDRREEKTIILTLKKSEWDTFRHELNKKYEEVKNY